MAEGTVRAGGNMTNTFVLMNVPDLDDKHDYLTEYLMETLPDVKVHSLHFHPGVPDRVLVVLDKEIDLVVAQFSIYQMALKGRYLRLQSAETMNAAIVKGEGGLQKLGLSSVKDLVQVIFGGREEIVTNCIQIPQSSEIVVCFTDAEVTRKVLECGILLKSPTGRLEVKPFFSNFHGLIWYRGNHFLHTLKGNSHSQNQSEGPSFHQSSEKIPVVENKPHNDMYTTFGHGGRNANCKISMTSSPFLNDLTSDISEDERNDGSPLQNAEMRKSLPLTDNVKGQIEHERNEASPLQNAEMPKSLPLTDNVKSQMEHVRNEGSPLQNAEMPKSLPLTDNVKSQMEHVRNEASPLQNAEMPKSLPLTDNVKSQMEHVRNEASPLQNAEMPKSLPLTDNLKRQMEHVRNEASPLQNAKMPKSFPLTDNVKGQIEHVRNEASPLQNAKMPKSFPLTDNVKGQIEHVRNEASPLQNAKMPKSFPLTDNVKGQIEHVRNEASPLQNAKMPKSFPLTDNVKGQIEHVRNEASPLQNAKMPKSFPLTDNVKGQIEHVRNEGSPLQNAKMPKSFPLTDNVKGQIEHVRNEASPLPNPEMPKNVPLTGIVKGQIEHVKSICDPKSVEEKSPDVHSTQAFLTAQLQPLSIGKSHAERNVNGPEVTLAAKPEMSKKKGEDVLTLSLSKVHWKLMKDKIKEENNEVTYDDEREILVVKGKNIECFMKSYVKLKDDVKECSIPLEDNKQMCFYSPYVKDKITYRLKEVEWTIDEGHIHIYGLNEWSFDCVKGKVKEFIENVEKTSIPTDMSDDVFTLLKNHHEKYSPVHMSRDVSCVTITGKSDAVREVKENLDIMSKVTNGKQWKQSSVQFLYTHYSLLVNFYGSELDDALKSVRYAWKAGQEGRVVIEFNGRLTDVKKAEEDLTTIQRSIQTEIIDVLAELGSTTNSLLIQRLSPLSEYDSLFHRQRSFEIENKCIIKNDVKNETSSQARGPCQAHGRGPQTSLPFDVNLENQKCSFRVFSSIQLEIKNYGDIVGEPSDVLVCFLPQNKSVMSTDVGQAFSKAIPGFEDKVNRLPSSDKNEVVFTEEMEFPGGPCIRLALVSLPRSPDETSFRQGVREVLLGASQFGAPSVCFHLLGVTYPEDFISENFCSALRGAATLLTDTSLQKLAFLATSKDLYEKMTHDAPAYFSLISQGQESKGLSDTWLVIEEKGRDFYFQDKKVEIQIVLRKSHENPIASLWKSTLESLIGRTCNCESL